MIIYCWQIFHRIKKIINFTTFGDNPQSRLEGYSAARRARASSSNRSSIISFSQKWVFSYDPTFFKIFQIYFIQLKDFLPLTNSGAAFTLLCTIRLLSIRSKSKWSKWNITKIMLHFIMTIFCVQLYCRLSNNWMFVSFKYWL